MYDTVGIGTPSVAPAGRPSSCAVGHLTSSCASACRTRRRQMVEIKWWWSNGGQRKTPLNQAEDGRNGQGPSTTRPHSVFKPRCSKDTRKTQRRVQHTQSDVSSTLKTTCPAHSGSQKRPLRARGRRTSTAPASISAARIATLLERFASAACRGGTRSSEDTKLFSKNVFFQREGPAPGSHGSGPPEERRPAGLRGSCRRGGHGTCQRDETCPISTYLLQ